MNRAGLLKEIDRLEGRVADLEGLVEDVAEAKVLRDVGAADTFEELREERATPSNLEAVAEEGEAFYQDPEGFLLLVPLLVGFDPSLKASALAGVTLDGKLTPVLASACPTAPGRARSDFFLLRQLDDAKRARSVNRWAVRALRAIPEGYRLAAIAMESPSGIPTSFAKPKPGDPKRPKGWRPPQDAQAFGKMVRGGQAVFDACAEVFAGNPVFVSTYAAKEAATGEKRPKDAKKEVARAVRRLFGPAVIDELLAGVKGGAAGREGVCDSLAVVLAAMESAPVRAAIEEYRRAVTAAEQG